MQQLRIRKSKSGKVLPSFTYIYKVCFSQRGWEILNKLHFRCLVLCKKFSL
ncbi:hypothetical protein BVRB_6g145350 [Beta vulgaris subsp. vulgaris]|uniref:Uncharacterized protein n=1 Tax=Beta vulgaris subsp. vulgaris TaxID=3555 RepID=A0A0J8C336_BETVV|nr:hypothetical protein BVRB_6g145350 [Beta vulgaris subsp. vulgaris]